MPPLPVPRQQPPRHLQSLPVRSVPQFPLLKIVLRKLVQRGRQGHPRGLLLRGDLGTILLSRPVHTLFWTIRRFFFFSFSFSFSFPFLLVFLSTFQLLNHGLLSRPHSRRLPGQSLASFFFISSLYNHILLRVPCFCLRQYTCCELQPIRSRVHYVCRRSSPDA